MNSIGQKSAKKYAQLYISKDLHNSIQLARKDGRRYNGKLFSNGLAFEMGAHILLETAESEEDILKQKLEDIKIKQNSLNIQKRLTNEQLKGLEVKKEFTLARDIKDKQDVELLVSKIVDSWDSIVLYREKKNIDFIITQFEGKLTRDKVAAIFPLKYEPAPTYEEAFQIASGLLGYVGDGWHA
jgi:hypothetical protein